MQELTRRHLFLLGGFAATGLVGRTANLFAQQKSDAATPTPDGENGLSQEEVQAALITANPEEIAELQKEIRASLDEQLLKIAWVMPEEAANQPDDRTARTINLGELQLPNQHRLHLHGAAIKWEVRQHRSKVSVTLSHPSLNDFVNVAVKCAVTAATASVIVSAVASPASGLALFLPTWKTCMYTKVAKAIVDKTKVTIDTHSQFTCWTNHC